LSGLMSVVNIFTVAWPACTASGKASSSAGVWVPRSIR